MSTRPLAPERVLERDQMIDRQLVARGIADRRVLDAFRAVSREAFVGPDLAEFAYEDAPLPIAEGQTISQPYVVALMVEQLELQPDDRVLEVGAGSGYAAAVLSRLAGTVHAVERHESLARVARERIRRLGFDNVEVHHGDGSEGWPDAAPFDAILVSAGGREVPKPLLDQLAPGGRLVIPAGGVRSQELLRITKDADGTIRQEGLGAVMFVPLVTGIPGREAAAPAVTRRLGLPDLVAEAIDPLASVDEAPIDPVLDRIGTPRIVLIGEASHGTSEFYRFRARLTRELIEAGRIGLVALEADWPDAARIDRFVRGAEPRGRAAEEHAFARFPTWMWRNEEVLAFVDWLRAWNDEQPRNRKVAVAGLDLYSLHESIARVIAYLDEVDPKAARVARQRYGCLTPYQSDPQTYGLAAMTEGYRQCEDDVVRMLAELLGRRFKYAAAHPDGEAFLDAAQNARLVANAERYYREMYRSGVSSWNLRDEHMFETLVALIEARGDPRGAVVWAHNSHLGDASATEMASRGELNVGQLVRERFGDEAYLVGFGTDRGTVAAAHAWDGEVQVMDVRPSHEDSYERTFHDSRVAIGSLGLRTPRPSDARTQLLTARLERAIGVVYRPETELMSHYFGAVLPVQFDEYVWIDETTAVTPLVRGQHAPLAEGHPFATLDV